ncbi:2285_t:CDS:2 [Entrophospora sp. SA101]|nr:2039_t:CDS:2 [Entrophospora sp. SA101]CAJ0747528.1 2285_t:CDS:2 [Entrophospora sp. SA101]CAJ0842528.1 2679_t:CDS:2 [Entrophospora sp. SA101]CAJ0852768.1 9171_t:CDS:2 [Entrophospora sp. SA101]CAJ0852779.1 9172_t:CDS:2 [Entrophospora sp. SA101]
MNSINNDIWVKSLVILTIIQAIVGIALEVRILCRNIKLRSDLRYISPNILKCDLEISLEKMDRIVNENIVFILFQIFQCWFCLSSIASKNTIQLITITISDLLCSTYGFVSSNDL